jgi:hypothetical protein
MPYSYDRLVHPQNIQSESDYNVKTLVLKQVDRVTYLLSIERAKIIGLSENYRALAFATKSALQSLEAMISPFIKEGSEYYIKTKEIKKALTYLEQTYAVHSRSYHYANLLNIWLSLIVKELSHLGYFPSQPYDDDDENYD